MRILLSLIPVLFQIYAVAQHRPVNDNFNIKIREAKGDLNGDGLIDKVIISMDTVNAKVPLRLQIFFAQPNKQLKLIVSSTKLIEPQYPNGQYSGHQIPDIDIENAELILISDTGHGQSSHRFKYKNMNFELVHFSKVYWDGKNTTTETDFDLLKGVKTIKSQGLGSEKILSKSKAKIWIRPLPKLQELTAFENKPYY